MRSASLNSDCVGTSDDVVCGGTDGRGGDTGVGLETTCGGAVDDDAAVDVGSKERTAVCVGRSERGGGGGFNAVSDRTSDCD